MPTMQIRKKTYLRLEKLALQKRLSPDDLLRRMIDSAEHDYKEREDMLRIFSEAAPDTDTSNELSLAKEDNVIYGLQFKNSKPVTHQD